jgi:hypothetical protein
VVDSALGQPSHPEVEEGSDDNQAHFPCQGESEPRSSPVRASAHAPETFVRQAPQDIGRDPGFRFG